MELHSRGASEQDSWPPTDRQLANAFDQATGAATLAWAEAVGDGQVPETRFACGPDTASVTAEARIAARQDRSALVRLAAALVVDGWEVRHLPGAVRRLFAHRGAVQLAASYAAASGTFALKVSSAPLPVGVDRARDLSQA
jgi:hypothetical protein